MPPTLLTRANELPQGFTWLRAALPESAADQAYQALLTEAPWYEQKILVYGRAVKQPRLIAFMADHPGLAYTYSRTAIKPTPWTSTVLALKEVTERLAHARFNICLLNLYRNGLDSMGWHSDDEAPLGRHPIIASWSLGATREFALRRHEEPGTLLMPLAHGDLLIMHGDAQRHWQHAVPRRRRSEGVRINLTFRYLHYVAPATI